MITINPYVLGFFVILAGGWLVAQAFSLPVEFLLGAVFMVVALGLVGMLVESISGTKSRYMASPVLAAILNFELAEIPFSETSYEMSPEEEANRQFQKAVAMSRYQVYAQDTVIELAAKLDEHFPNMISTSVRISSGSIRLSLEILAISHELLSKYDKFVKSVNVISKEISSVFSEIALESEKSGNPLFALRQDVSIEPKSKLIYGVRSRPTKTSGLQNVSSSQQNLVITLPAGCMALFFVLVLVLSGLLTIVSLYLSNHLWIDFVP